MSKTVSKTTPLIFIISSSDLNAKSQRADRFLAKRNGLPSRSQLQSWFEQGCVTRGGKALAADSMVRVGDQIDIQIPAPRESTLDARPMDLRIFYEDDDLIVLLKPRGLSIHPGAGKKDVDTLVHGLLALSKNWSDRSGGFRPGIVHRLDKDTEGLVVVAKNNETHESLAKQFSERSVQRNYWALCWGKAPEKFIVEGLMGRHPRDRKKFAMLKRGGKMSESHFRRLGYFGSGGYSWVECKLQTGRTHQIRVHLSHKGLPLLGDQVYGRSKKVELTPRQKAAFESLKGQALVAFRLGFVHPRTGKSLLFEMDAPEWLKILTT